MPKKEDYVVELLSRISANKPRTYWWRVSHRNKNVLVTSETYKQKGTRTRVANNFARTLGLEVHTIC